MRFVNLQTTSERAGKGQVRQLILRRPINLQSAASPVLALGDADTGLFQSADDVLEFATAGVSRFKVLADGTVAVAGNLVVNGTTTTVNSTTLTVDDKNIELGSVATPSDTTADGGGITLKGATDKTFNWVDSTDAWTSSEHINLASGKTFQLNGTAITSSATELNLLDNVSGLVQADLTKLAAVNSTAAELNLLNAVSGLVQADLTKLAAVDASATELNYTDGVTSAIQTQMDAKLATTTAASTYAPIASPTFTGNFTSVGIDDNADATAITIDSSERVGIGTSSPDSTRPAKLHVVVSNAETDLSMGRIGDLDIENTNTTTNSFAGLSLRSASFDTGITAIYSGTANQGRLAFHTDHGGAVVGESLSILHNGNVGIGTTIPNNKLTIEGDGSRINWRNGASYANLIAIRGNRSGTSSGNMYFETWDGTGATNALVARIAIEGTLGHVLPGADNIQNLGASGQRWANIYTTDLHLANDRGDWTVIEEEDYLTLRNNKTDKIYKLVMEEI